MIQRRVLNKISVKLIPYQGQKYSNLESKIAFLSPELFEQCRSQISRDKSFCLKPKQEDRKYQPFRIRDLLG